MNSFYEKITSQWPFLIGMPPWALYLSMALIILVLAILIKIAFFRHSKDNPYKLYKKDSVFRVDWTWEYRKRLPFGITCACPTCGNTLFYDEHRSGNAEGVETSLECEKCDRTLARLDGTYISLLKRVQGHIERKIATGGWKEKDGESRESQA